MPGTQSDGSIRIDTKLDNSGFVKGSNELRQAVRSLTDQVNATGGKLQNAFKIDFGHPKQAAHSFADAVRQINAEIANLGELAKKALDGDKDALGKFLSESTKTADKLESMNRQLDSFADKEFKTKSYTDIEGQYKKAVAQVENLERSLENAKEASERLKNEFYSSDKYRAVEARIANAQEMEARQRARGNTKNLTLVKNSEAARQQLIDAFMASSRFASAESKVADLAEQLKTAKENAQELKEQMEETPQTYIGAQTDEYRKDSDALERAINQFNRYQEQVGAAMGGPDDAAQPSRMDVLYEKWQQMATLSGIIRNAFSTMFGAISSGARTAGAAIAIGVTHPLQLIDRLLAGIGIGITAAMGGMASGAFHAAGALARITSGTIVSGLKLIADAAKRAAAHLMSMAGGYITSRLQKLGKTLHLVGKQSNRSNMSLKKGLKMLLRYGLGIRSVYILFNKLRNAIKEGFGNLAKEFPEFEQKIKEFKAATKTLKNSIAASFEPVANVILDFITKLVSGLSEAISKVGQLIAAFAGQSNYKKAIAVQADMIDSTDDTTDSINNQSKAAKKNQKVLAGFDDVEILKSNSSESSDNKFFEEKAVEEDFTSLAQALKDMWKAADFSDLGRSLGERINAAFTSIPWAKIQDTAARVGKSIATFANGLLDVPGLFYNFGRSMGEALNTAYAFVESIVGNLNWEAVGKAFEDGIIGFLDTINWELIYKTMQEAGAGFGRAFEAGFNNAEIWTKIITAFNNFLRAILIKIHAFLTNVTWGNLGTNIGTAINEGIADFPWQELADTIVALVNAAIDTAYGLLSTIDFKGFGQRVGRFLASAIRRIDWKKGGASVGLAIMRLYEAVDGFITGMDWESLGAAVVDAIGGFFDKLDWATAGSTLSHAASALLTALAGAFDEIEWSELPGKIMTAIHDFFMGNEEKGTEGFDFTGLATSIGELLGAAFTALVAVGGSLWETLIDFGNQLMEGGFEGIKKALSDIGAWVKTNVWDPLVKAFKDKFEIADGTPTLKDVGAFLIKALKAGIKGAMSLIGGFLRLVVVNPIVRGVKRLFGIGGENSLLLEIGKNLISGLKNGIASGMSFIGTWIRENIVEKFMNAIKKLFGIASPSTLMMEIGGYLIDGLKNGIVNGVKWIGTWIRENIVDRIVNSVKTLFGLDGNAPAFLVIGSQLIEGLKDGIFNVISGIGAWIKENIVDKIISDVKAFFGIGEEEPEFLKIGSDLIEGLKDGIFNVISGIRTWIKENIVDKIVNGVKALFGLDEGGTPVFFTIGSSLIAGLKDGILSAMDGMANWMERNILNPIKQAAGLETYTKNSVTGAISTQINGSASDDVEEYEGALTDLMETYGLTTDQIALFDHAVTDYNDYTAKQFGRVLTNAGILIEDFGDGVLRTAGSMKESNPYIAAMNNAVGGIAVEMYLADSSADNLNTGVTELGGSAESTAGNAGHLQEAFDGLGSTGLDSSQLVAILWNAVHRMGEEGKLSQEQIEGLENTLSAYESDPIETSMAEVQKAFADTGISAGDLEDSILTAMGSISEGFLIDEEMKKAASDFETFIKATGTTAGRNLGSGYSGGVDESRDDAVRAATEMTNDTLSAIDETQDSHSPSREAMKRGGYLVEGFAIGVSENLGDLIRVIRDAFVRSILEEISGGFGIHGTDSTVTEEYGSALINGLRRGIEYGQNAVISVVQAVMQNVYNAFSAYNAYWEAAGQNITAGLTRGMQSYSTYASAAARNVAASAYNSVIEVLSIHSPSKKFHWIGEMMAEGMGAGITDAKDTAVSAAVSLADAVTDEASGTNPFMQIGASVTDGIDSVLSAFSDRVTQSFSAMVSAMESIANGASFTTPAMADGSVVPYSARRSAYQDDTDNLSTIAEILAQRDAGRLTRGDLTEVFTALFRQYLNIDFYIGDEQVARHANAGNAKLNRRYSTVT